MNKKTKFIAAICALVMSTSTTMPAYAIPPKSQNSQQSNSQDYQKAINVVKERLKIFKDRLDEYAFNSNDLNSIKSSFSKIDNKFNSSELELLSCSSEEFYTKLLDFHTDIDELNNDLDKQYISNFCVMNNKINSKLFTIVNADIESRKNNGENQHQKAELRQLKARLPQLKFRIDYCLYHFKNVKNRLSSNMLNNLNEKFDGINGVLNSILEDIHFNANKLNDLTIFHEEINKSHELIDILEKDLEIISNSSDEQLQKQDIMEKLSSLTLYNANTTAKQMKILGKKAGYNGWENQKQQVKDLISGNDEFKDKCIEKYLKGYRCGARKLKVDQFNSKYRREIRKYIKYDKVIKEDIKGEVRNTTCHVQ